MKFTKLFFYIAYRSVMNWMETKLSRKIIL